MKEREKRVRINDWAIALRKTKSVRQFLHSDAFGRWNLGITCQRHHLNFSYQWKNVSHSFAKEKSKHCFQALITLWWCVSFQDELDWCDLKIGTSLTRYNGCIGHERWRRTWASASKAIQMISSSVFPSAGMSSRSRLRAVPSASVNVSTGTEKRKIFPAMAVTRGSRRVTCGGLGAGCGKKTRKKDIIKKDSREPIDRTPGLISIGKTHLTLGWTRF